MPYPLSDIVHIRNVDHPESISIGPNGEAYTTGTAGQIYRLSLDDNSAEAFCSVAPGRILGQAIDADGYLYCADCHQGNVLRISPRGETEVYATRNAGAFECANYPAFDRAGNLYLSDSGDFSDTVNGFIYKIPRGGGTAERWCPQPLYTPNAIALDADERFLYFAETYGERISRIAILPSGEAGDYEHVVSLPRYVPDGIALDEDGRLWIACFRPDSILVFDPRTNELETFAEDWRGRELRSPTDVAFAGPNRDVLLAAALGNLCVHRFDQTGVRGLKLAHPQVL